MRVNIGVASGRSATAAVAFVSEVVELAENFIPALNREEFGRFQRRAVVLGDGHTAGPWPATDRRYTGARRRSNRQDAAAVQDKNHENLTNVP
jgi:hypothetical protein